MVLEYNEYLLLLESKNELKSKCMNVFDKVKNKFYKKSKTSNETMYALRGAEFYVDKYDTSILKVNGGYNGSSDWEEYLAALKNLVSKLEEHGIHAWIIDLKNDCPDDVFDTKIGVQFKETE